jgi:cytochrome c oxidase assembly protein subunit 15
LSTPPGDFAALAGRIHEYSGVGAGGLTVLVLMMVLPTNTPDWVRGLAWAAMATVGIDIALSLLQVRVALGPGLAIGHAALAPVVVSFLAALAVFTTLDWSLTRPETADFSKVPKLPLAAKLTPLAVLLQIVLGAAYRHRQLDVMWHMGGALLAALFLLVAPVILLQKFGEHPSLRPAAIAALSAALLQITLGIAAFVMRLLDFDTSTAFIALSAAHVVVGSVVLAASLVLAIMVTICVERE